MTLTVKNKIGKKAWLQGYAIGTKKVYEIGFDIFIEFMNDTQEGEWDDQRLIRERQEDIKTRSFAFEQKAIEFYEWLKEYNSNFSDHTRKTYLLTIRSFFAYHRLDLRFTRQQKSKITRKARPKWKFYDFTLADVQKMLGVAKPKEKYILACGKELGLRALDFANLKQGRFTAHLNEEVPISLGEIYTIIEGETATLFLGYDGKQAVKQWLTVLKSRGKYDPQKPMLQISKKELTVILARLAERANIELGNQRVRFHELRVFLITRLSKVLETNRWKQIVGKAVPESAYVKPFELRDDYRKVLPLITVDTSSILPQNKELQKLNKRITNLEKENIQLRELITEKEENKIRKLKTQLHELQEKYNQLDRNFGHLARRLRYNEEQREEVEEQAYQEILNREALEQLENQEAERKAWKPIKQMKKNEPQMSKRNRRNKNKD